MDGQLWLYLFGRRETDAERGELQKLHDKWIKKLDALIDAKNKEIMTV